ncbi:unnamed protein product [Caenorhabditis brenneri]
MAVRWVVTNKMIDCFQHCTRIGDFHPFLTEYQRFLGILAEFAQQVVFPDDILCQTICQELPLLFSYLIKWNSKDVAEKSDFIKITAHLEDKIPKFVESLKLAIATSNWKKFYRQCKPIADRIIDEARRQGVISLEISYKSRFYKNFEALESAMNSESGSLKVEVKPEEKTKTAQEDSKMSSTKEPLAGGTEDSKKVLQKISNVVELIEQDLVKFFEALEDKIETRLGNMKTSSNYTFESRIEVLGKSLEKKFDETTTGLTMGLINNEKKIEQIAVNLKSLEVEIKRTSEEILMKLLKIAQQMKLEDNERMAARIETLFANLQKNYDEMKVDSMKRSEQKLDELVAKIEWRLKLKEEKLDGKLKEIKLREEALDKKMEVMMELIREGFQKQGEQKMVENDSLESKTVCIDKCESLGFTTEFLLSMEHKLEKLVTKIEIKTQEQEERIRLREEKLDKKMESMMELKRQGFEQQNQQKMAGKKEPVSRNSQGSSVSITGRRPSNAIIYDDCSHFSDDPYEIDSEFCLPQRDLYKRHVNSVKLPEERKMTLAYIVENSVRQHNLQEPYEILEPQIPKDIKNDLKLEFRPVSAKPALSDSIPGSSAITSLTTSDLTDDDEELRNMQEAFEKQLAEQEARYAVKMKELKEKGRQKNEKAQKEIQDLTRNLSRH